MAGIMEEDNLFNILTGLDKLKKEFLKEVKLFITMGPNIHQMDLYTSAIINRAIALIDGFVILTKYNNYISSVPLIRMQLDNSLRFYAATLVNDYDNFYIRFLKGEHISNIKDATGAKMSDRYLVDKLSTLYPGIEKLYRNTSGYIHFSKEHSSLQTSLSNDSEREISIQVGSYDFYSIQAKIDFAFNMYKASEILLELTKSWKFQKLKIDNGIST